MNLLTIIVIILLLLFGIGGIKEGFIKGIFSALFSALGLGVLFILLKGIGSFVQKDILNIILALIFLVLIRIVYRIVKLINDSLNIVKELPGVNFFDHVLGLVIGLLHGLVFIWFLLALFSILNPFDVFSWIQEQRADSAFADLVYSTNVFFYLAMLLF